MDDLIDNTSTVLDELWRLDSFSYSQSRMEKLMDIIGNSIALHIQNKLRTIDIWNEEFNTVRDVVNSVSKNIINKY